MKGTRKLGRAGVFFNYYYYFHVLSQFSGPDYLEAWNRLLATTSSPGRFFLALEVGAPPPTSKAREESPGDEVVLAIQAMSRQLQIGGRGRGVLDQYLRIGEPLRV